MNSQSDAVKSSPNTPNEPNQQTKRTYRPPQLSVYGGLRELTQAVGISGMLDGSNELGMRMTSMFN